MAISSRSGVVAKFYMMGISMVSQKFLSKYGAGETTVVEGLMKEKEQQKKKLKIKKINCKSNKMDNISFFLLPSVPLFSFFFFLPHPSPFLSSPFFFLNTLFRLFHVCSKNFFP